MRKWLFTTLGACALFAISCSENSQVLNPVYIVPRQQIKETPYVLNFEWLRTGSILTAHISFSTAMSKPSVENNAYVYRITGDMKSGLPQIDKSPEKTLRTWWDGERDFYLDVKLEKRGQYIFVLRKSAVSERGIPIDGNKFKSDDGDFSDSPSDFYSFPYNLTPPGCPSAPYRNFCYAGYPGKRLVEIKSIKVLVGTGGTLCNYYCGIDDEPKGIDCGEVICEGGVFDGCFMKPLFGLKGDKRYFSLEFSTPTTFGIALDSLKDEVKIFEFNTRQEATFSVGLTYSEFTTFDELLPGPPEGVKRIFLRPENLNEGNTYVLQINSTGGIRDLLGTPMRDGRFDGEDDTINFYFTTHSCKGALEVKNVTCSEDGSFCDIVIDALRGSGEVKIDDKLIGNQVKGCEVKDPACSDFSCCNQGGVDFRVSVLNPYPGRAVLSLSFPERPSFPILLFISHTLKDASGRLLDGNANGVGEGNAFDDWIKVIE